MISRYGAFPAKHLDKEKRFVLHKPGNKEKSRIYVTTNWKVGLLAFNTIVFSGMRPSDLGRRNAKKTPLHEIESMDGCYVSQNAKLFEQTCGRHVQEEKPVSASLCT
jgi:hypothetical protein